MDPIGRGAQELDQERLGIVFPLADDPDAGLIQRGHLVDKYRKAIHPRQSSSAEGYIGDLHIEELPLLNAHGTRLPIPMCR
jgi:hypothetical protein